MGFEEVRHTADLALRVWGGSLEELFAEAARGMFSLIGVACSSESVRWIDLHADDLETLLVDWLNELIYLSDSHGEVYSEFDLQVTSGWHLEGEARGGPMCHRIGTVKAATYHGLCIERKQDQYSVTVVFDT